MAETEPPDGTVAVTVTRDTKILSDRGTVVELTGTCEGRPVSFFAEPRYASDLADAVEAEGEAVAIVDSYLVSFPGDGA